MGIDKDIASVKQRMADTEFEIQRWKFVKDIAPDNWVEYVQYIIDGLQTKHSRLLTWKSMLEYGVNNRGTE